jgi:HEAT repeat protein
MLAEMGPAAAAAKPALIARLQHDAPDLRSAAARALGAIGPQAADAVPALEGLLDDNEPDVRKAAAHAIRQLNSPSAAEADGPRVDSLTPLQD